MAQKVEPVPTIEEDRAEKQKRRDAYWKANVRLILGLLAIWAVVSYGFSILLAGPLYNIQFFGLPLSFWFAQQGSIIVFVLLIFYYAWRMNQIDREFDVEE